MSSNSTRWCKKASLPHGGAQQGRDGGSARARECSPSTVWSCYVWHRGSHQAVEASDHTASPAAVFGTLRVDCRMQFERLLEEWRAAAEGYHIGRFSLRTICGCCGMQWMVGRGSTRCCRGRCCRRAGEELLEDGCLRLAGSRGVGGVAMGWSQGGWRGRQLGVLEGTFVCPMEACSSSILSYTALATHVRFAHNLIHPVAGLVVSNQCPFCMTTSCKSVALLNAVSAVWRGECFADRSK